MDRKDLFDIVVPRPSVSEQSLLAAAIDQQLADFDRSILFKNREIELLREYRTRLVADVVTGKLNVQDAARQLDSASSDVVIDDDAELDVETETSNDEAEVV